MWEETELVSAMAFLPFFFFDIGPSPENTKSRVEVSLRDIVEDQRGFRSRASLRQFWAQAEQVTGSMLSDFCPWSLRPA